MQPRSRRHPSPRCYHPPSLTGIPGHLPTSWEGCYEWMEQGSASTAAGSPLQTQAVWRGPKSGALVQVYYHLSQLRTNRRVRDVVLVRLEQIAPFPHDKVIGVLDRYPAAEASLVPFAVRAGSDRPWYRQSVPSASWMWCSRQPTRSGGLLLCTPGGCFGSANQSSPAQVVWCQEEPKNMGAWSYVRPRLVTALEAEADARGQCGRPTNETGTEGEGIRPLLRCLQGCRDGRCATSAGRPRP